MVEVATSYLAVIPSWFTACIMPWYARSLNPLSPRPPTSKTTPMDMPAPGSVDDEVVGVTVVVVPWVVIVTLVDDVVVDLEVER